MDVVVVLHPARDDDGEQVHKGLWNVHIDGHHVAHVWNKPGHYIHFFAVQNAEIIQSVQDAVANAIGEKRPVSLPPDLSFMESADVDDDEIVLS